MIETLEKTKAEVLDACEWREHKMGPWIATRFGAYCECMQCGAWADINLNSASCGFGVGGPAVAINCDAERKEAIR
ncbi:MAG: hypothetical protein DRP09_19020 [Candidatus Thorarchaeota archaeon]|nr:MAG: hypothetical protein DRP09_19020 [Candidatus Thorarchaeota archaeon]